MKNILVWDLPMRLFHWTFAGSLSVALAIGFLADDDSAIFPYHMLFGLVACFALLVRILLGIFGSRHNRFSAMPLHPLAVVEYMTGALTGKARRYVGHNPGCAVAALAMFGIVPLLIATGAGWLGEEGMDFHEGLAIALLAAIGAHLAGIILHSIRHKEMLALSMLTGRKNGPPEEGLPHAGFTWAAVIFVIGAAWVWALFASHDPVAENVRLPVIGTVIHLGEDEGDEHD